MDELKVIDLRSPYEKHRDAVYDRCEELFREVYPTAMGATPERVLKYVAKETGLTRETVRRVLIRKGIYHPRNSAENKTNKPIVIL